MPNRPNLVDKRTCNVDVQYLRGQNGGRDGFWIVETCAQEKYASTSFQFGGAIPRKPADIASHVLAWSDFEREGISGKGGDVRTIGRDNDSARFVVTARVVGIADQQPCTHPGCTQTDGKPCAYAQCPQRGDQA